MNLLAYPLGIVTEPEAVKRDLAYYEEKIDKVNGPAMGSAILSVLHARLGDAEEAYRLFKKSYIPNSVLLLAFCPNRRLRTILILQQEPEACCRRCCMGSADWS